jgi:predicted O-methyltransferase YrrM
MQKVIKFLYNFFNKLYFSNTHKTLKKNSKTKKELNDIWLIEQNKEYKQIDEYEKHSGYLINKNFFHNLGFLTQVTDKESEISYSHGRILYSCLSKYCNENNLTNVNILEVGTARGFSSLCMAKALDDNFVLGKIITLDILPLRENIFWNCIADEFGKQSRMQLLKNYEDLINKYLIFLQMDTLTDYRKLLISRINFAFIDGCHDKKHLKSEFKIISSSQIRGDIILFDDYSITNFPSLYDEINNICNIHSYSRQIVCSKTDRCYLIATKL